jgi:hypothetical protein
MITSNTITITDKLTQGETISAEIDNGVFVINGVDTNSTSVVVQTGDTIAIKLKSPLVSGDVEKSTLLIGQNSLIFKIGIDRYAPIFSSPKNFTLIASDSVLVTNIEASDEHEVTYSIVDGNDSALFSIDSNSGRLTFLSTPDYEVNFTYTLSVKATDILNNVTVESIAVNYKRFIRDSIGIVLDNHTGYSWQDNIIKTFIHTDAVSYCNALSLQGHDDWFLPSRSKLATIIDNTRYPSISQVFENTRSGARAGYSTGEYWSSSYYRDYGGYNYYYVDFNNGHVGDTNAIVSHNVRCVRTGQ